MTNFIRFDRGDTLVFIIFYILHYRMSGVAIKNYSIKFRKKEYAVISIVGYISVCIQTNNPFTPLRPQPHCESLQR
jgi:hypothetical protein